MLIFYKANGAYDGVRSLQQKPETKAELKTDNKAPTPPLPPTEKKAEVKNDQPIQKPVTK